MPYAQEYARCPEIEVVALADPVPARRALMAKRAGLPAGLPGYDDWRDILRRHPKLDGVVICTPNNLHAGHALPFLERGLAVAIEKPLATTAADCERIIEAERRHGARTLIGFVLRSAPFYAGIHELVRSGAIGGIVAIEADELVRWVTTSLFMRGTWRRSQAASGGSMLEKCCHDMDILNWMMASRPASLDSHGGRLIFGPTPALPAACPGCGVRRDCVYRADQAAAEGEQADRAMHRFLEHGDACVFTTEKDIADVQSVQVEYENGAIATFLLSFNAGGSTAGRNIRIIGRNGSIWGNMDAMAFTVFDNRTGRETVHPVKSDGSGHGGGDRRHVLELLAMMRDPAYRPAQNAEAGYLSAVMSLAADVARVERRRVHFRYRDGGFVDMV